MSSEYECRQRIEQDEGMSSVIIRELDGYKRFDSDALHATLVGATSDTEVAVLAPICAPAVLYRPVWSADRVGAITNE